MSTNSEEKTFRSYSQEQGKQYAELRRDYDPSVYQAVLDHHMATGGRLDSLVDVGCGPGNAARALAPHFAYVVGVDPSEGMIAVARTLVEDVTTASSAPIEFKIATAEHLDAAVADASVDLVTASNAAHWFDMAGFWRAAARVVRPGGSVAIWSSGEMAIDPSLPAAAAVEAAIEACHERYFRPYYEPGNLLVRNGYADLPLPWTLDEPVAEFDEASFYRRQWQAGERFFVGLPEADMDTFEKMMATGSAQTRWRQAHPDDVGTERDPVRMLRRDIERLLHEAGVEKGKEVLRGYAKGVVLIVKRK